MGLVTQNGSSADVGDKVAAVSRAVSDALVAIDAGAYLRPLLTARTTLGDIHGALHLIKDAKEVQLAKEDAPCIKGTGQATPSAAGAAFWCKVCCLAGVTPRVLLSRVLTALHCLPPR